MITAPTLWPYQVGPVQEIRSLLADNVRRIVFWMPTGAGKGHVAKYIIHGATAKGRRVLFLVNRILLVDDMSRRLDGLGIDHGIIQSTNARRKPWLPVHVASVDTLHRRHSVPPADILIIDECHHACSPTWKKVIDRYPNAAVIGLSATPSRHDGKALSDIFQRIVYGPSVAELIAINAENRGQGVVPIKVYAPAAPDLTGVHKVAGEYNQRELAAKFNRPQLVGDLVAHWLKLGRGRPTIGWAVDKQHARSCTDRFLAAGIRSGYMDDKTPSPERWRLLGQLRRYELEVIWSIGVLGYGVDAPEVSCGIDAARTLSVARWLQRIGRLARALHGKEYSLLLDHSGNTLEHGFFEDDREWSLDGDGQGKRKNENDDGPAVRMCRVCFCAFPASQDKCPECGAPYIAKKRDLRHVDGELQEVAPVRRFRCQACGQAGRLPEGADYSITCPICQAGHIAPLGGKPAPTYLTKAELDARKARWYELFRQGKIGGVNGPYKDAWARMRFNQEFARTGSPPYWPPRKWIEEAEQRWAMESAFEEATA